VDDGSFAKLLIARDRLLLAVSTTHRLARRQSVALAELAGENFIGLAKGTLVQELAVTACRSAGFEPRIYYESLRADTICQLVAENSGIALIMERILDYEQRTDVLAVPLAEAVDGNVILAWPKNKRLSTPARAFVEFMKNDACGA
jgi:LysR family transcriptional activator of glutamate synthase operon